MFGTGLPEIIVILLVVLLLFGPAAVTFWIGYTMGQSKATEASADPSAAGESSADTEEEGTDE